MYTGLKHFHSFFANFVLLQIAAAVNIAQLHRTAIQMPNVLFRSP